MRGAVRGGSDRDCDPEGIGGSRSARARASHRVVLGISAACIPLDSFSREVNGSSNVFSSFSSFALQCERLKADLTGQVTRSVQTQKASLKPQEFPRFLRYVLSILFRAKHLSLPSGVEIRSLGSAPSLWKSNSNVSEIPQTQIVNSLVLKFSKLIEVALPKGSPPNQILVPPLLCFAQFCCIVLCQHFSMQKLLGCTKIQIIRGNFA